MCSTIVSRTTFDDIISKQCFFVKLNCQHNCDAFHAWFGGYLLREVALFSLRKKREILRQQKNVIVVIYKNIYNSWTPHIPCFKVPSCTHQTTLVIEWCNEWLKSLLNHQEFFSYLIGLDIFYGESFRHDKGLFQISAWQKVTVD